jgi:regulator of nucleoside diphosphate kinase
VSCLIAAAGRLSKRGRAELAALERELPRAEIVAPRDMPPDVITMNSRAELLDRSRRALPTRQLRKLF